MTRFPRVSAFLQFLSRDRLGARLGGLYHRGRPSYSTESSGLCYLFLFVFLLISDLSILSPWIKGDIEGVMTDFREYNESTGEFKEMTIADFKNVTQLQITLVSETTWKSLSC
mmetsp:Transcript_18085/g.30870  ORF Transcript_18085/g.30870 Transcript_18085/m.30870 type:complete len:113 (-) Transcript_18085:934-1272(-)